MPLGSRNRLLKAGGAVALFLFLFLILVPNEKTRIEGIVRGKNAGQPEGIMPWTNYMLHRRTRPGLHKWVLRVGEMLEILPFRQAPDTVCNND
jgi:hypothetical protein